jgi:hypothetical protein
MELDPIPEPDPKADPPVVEPEGLLTPLGEPLDEASPELPLVPEASGGLPFAPLAPFAPFGLPGLSGVLEESVGGGQPPGEPPMELELKVDPEEPKLEPEEPKLDPDEPKLEPEDPKLEPEEPKLEPEEPKLDPEDPKLEPLESEPPEGFRPFALQFIIPPIREPAIAFPKNPMAVGALFWPSIIGFQSSLPVNGSTYFLRRKRMPLVGLTRASRLGG